MIMKAKTFLLIFYHKFRKNVSTVIFKVFDTGTCDPALVLRRGKYKKYDNIDICCLSLSIITTCKPKWGTSIKGIWTNSPGLLCSNSIGLYHHREINVKIHLLAGAPEEDNKDLTVTTVKGCSCLIRHRETGYCGRRVHVEQFTQNKLGGNKNKKKNKTK